MKHLPENWEFVKRQLCLVLAIDALVSDQACSCDHVCGHTFSDEQNHVLRLSYLLERLDFPGSNRGITTIVTQDSFVNAWSR
jgi:hypothetical protein